MKIDGNNPIEAKDLYGNIQDIKKNQEAEKKADTEKTEGSADRISLSGRAREISELKGMIEALPEIRTNKIEDIKKALDSGSYNIDSLKVAEKILQEI